MHEHMSAGLPSAAALGEYRPLTGAGSLRSDRLRLVLQLVRDSFATLRFASENVRMFGVA
eukprot:7985271-Pyramimonas_sp.AAC.2